MTIIRCRKTVLIDANTVSDRAMKLWIAIFGYWKNSRWVSIPNVPAGLSHLVQKEHHR